NLAAAVSLLLDVFRRLLRFCIYALAAASLVLCILWARSPWRSYGIVRRDYEPGQGQKVISRGWYLVSGCHRVILCYSVDNDWNFQKDVVPFYHAEPASEGIALSSRDTSQMYLRKDPDDIAVLGIRFHSFVRPTYKGWIVSVPHAWLIGLVSVLPI